MTRTLPDGRTAQAAEDEPFASVPESATRAEITQHRNSLVRAVAQVREGSDVDSAEKYIRERLARYLRSNFDPRPFEEIAENIRAIVTSELSRV